MTSQKPRECPWRHLGLLLPVLPAMAPVHPLSAPRVFFGNATGPYIVLFLTGWMPRHGISFQELEAQLLEETVSTQGFSSSPGSTGSCSWGSGSSGSSWSFRPLLLVLAQRAHRGQDGWVSPAVSPALVTPSACRIHTASGAVPRSQGRKWERMWAKNLGTGFSKNFYK